MGFVFKKDTLKEGILMGTGFFFFAISLFYLRALFLHEPLNLSIKPPLLYFIVSITIIPLSEEAFFRGILQTKLQNIKKLSSVLALFLASFVYALFHIPKILFIPESFWFSMKPKFLTNYNFSHPSFLLLCVLLLGLYFGYTFQQTKSLYWPILAHILVNIFIFTLIIS